MTGIRIMGTRLAVSAAITAVFVVVEAAAGILSNSLVLLTDAAHNLTDVIALVLSWMAVRFQGRPSTAAATYGFHRVGILVALLNCATLILIALGVFYEAVRRLMVPSDVQASAVVTVGVLALVVNLLTARLVRRPAETDLNLRSAFAHLMGDVLSTAAAIIAGVLIHFTGANWLDPAASMIIAVLIAYNAWRILREAVDILLESAPSDIDVDALAADLLALRGVLGVHDLHVWSLTRDLRSMSAHILTADVPISAASRIQDDINELVAARYAISHSTLQLECVDCDTSNLYCDPDAWSMVDSDRAG